MKRKLFGGAMALVMLFCALAATAIEAGEGPYRVHQHLTARGPGEGCDCDGTELCTHLPLVIIDTGGAEVPGVPVGHDGNGEEVYSTTADGDSMLDARISILDDETRNHHPSDEPDIESAGLIRIRGRSSRHFDKHNYLLRFTKDDGSYASHEVMGMDSHYEWALHGPYLDKSLIRNYLWYNIAGEMMDYAPNVRFCEVILNGEYQGLYLMTETITNGDGCRVNVSEPIDNSKATGYVLRLDQGSKTDLKNINNFTYYTYRIGRKNRLNIDIEYPRSGTLTQEMADAIEQDLSDFEKSLYSFDYDTQFYGYENWIDVNSFADYFLINEFTQNYDAGALSTYLYKDIGGKYILGVEWEDVTVAYTNETHPDRGQYHGAYLETTEDATPFEAMLAQVGDSIIEYETERYRQQRLVAFSNWPTTDPFLYPADITNFFMKCAQVDVEHIQTTDAFLSGCFASYHVYPYYPDYLHNILDPMGAVDSQGRDMSSYYFTTEGGVPYEEMMTGDDQEDYYDLDGHLNTYYAYLRMLNEYHTVPVVISEYGVSTGRGMAQRDYYTGRNQGRMTEREQGDALIDCYEDIMNAGSAGICIFTWQDEWFKRTWNTMANVDLDRTPYWSDYQTNEQYFGLLAFDPGEVESVSYTDGDISEWAEGDLVWSGENGSIYMKYDEKFVYFYVDADARSGPIYIPIDTTPKTGTTYCENYGLSFERPVDFVICINGEDNSRVVVQERYDAFRAMFYPSTVMIDPYVNEPDTDTPVFNPINLVLQLLPEGSSNPDIEAYDVYETGKLRCGVANPEADNFDSLADFCFTPDGGVEIRLPWQMLNFADPSQMSIHDDYYENYGIEYIQIDEMYVGLATASEDTRVRMSAFALEGWGNDVTYHERLKESYYILQEYWAEN